MCKKSGRAESTAGKITGILLCKPADGDRHGFSLVFGVEPCIPDKVARALRRALTAGDAFCIVDLREVIHNVDRIVLTGLFADGAADAADVAVLAQHGALLPGVTRDGYVGLVRDLNNKILGAGGGAGHASGTLFVVDTSDAVLYEYCAERTNLDAGTETEATVRALVGAAPPA